ncbi:energy-coupled thiamine transporter ThiT [Bombilactobacillus bombi]|uniref:energy-coupled thiamine transporter ThiT n=1 Tax=Bombilactobacillus bombi TaxID=1303590 RepID=UPI0015E5E486|nr:energy-coupled thiamine transporter ThiT [Bombilactobacillus bombi]MBA1433659.1 energy-coupled thiamine transporter ThiT [Bombilactobacillus bombi]
MKTQNQTTVTVEGAIIVALATALTYIPNSFGVSSIELQYGTIPVVIYAWRRGLRAGAVAGMVWGILEMLLFALSNGSVVNPWQGLLEYPIAFGVLGLAGLWSSVIQTDFQQHRSVYSIMLLSSLVAICSKYLLHFIAGGIVWAAYAPRSMNPWLYSLIINGGSAIANIIMVAFVLLLLKRFLKRLVIVN